MEDIQFDRITNNSLGWSRYFEENQSNPQTEKDRVAMAFGKIKPRISGIIRDRLINAIESAGIGGESEYAREPLKNGLLDAFLDDGMVGVAEDGSIYLNTDIAGDTSDLMDGINSARETLKSFGKGGNELSPAQKSTYWRKFVYPSYSGGSSQEPGDDDEQSDDMWTRTIGLRFSYWQGLAPYWYWLEHGNTGAKDEGGIPYPKNKATNFVMKIEAELNRLMGLALLEVDSLETNVINDTLTKFVEDPENHQPYDILEEFYQDGRKYYVYITPTRRIGTTLQTSYKRMYGR